MTNPKDTPPATPTTPAEDIAAIRKTIAEFEAGLAELTAHLIVEQAASKARAHASDTASEGTPSRTPSITPTAAAAGDSSLSHHAPATASASPSAGALG